MRAVALRLLLRITNRAGYLAVAMVTLVTGTGMLYDHFENKAFWDSLWWAVVTAATVGYGDLYPKTVGGRIAAMMLIIGMVLFILPLITAQFASKLIVDSNAFTNDEQEELKHNIAVIAETLMHVKARTCLCIWDDRQEPMVVNPQCTIHASQVQEKNETGWPFI